MRYALLAAAEMHWGTLAMGLFGGLALFLLGMDRLAESLKAVAGNRMRDVLRELTTNRFMAVLTGTFVTAVIQSSSVTTVLVVGFVSAGILSAAQSVGVIMGANVGTTVTAQIVAFNVTEYALLLVAVGFGVGFAGKGDRIRQYGDGVMGLGLVFFGMGVMGDSMAPLREYEPFLTGMAGLENPLLGVIAGAVFTALIQSSSATTAVVIVMATTGVMTLPAGIAVTLGANIGTCVTALLASLGKPREAMRAAAVHILFNVAGVLVWLPFVDFLAGITASFSPVAEGIEGIEKLAAETPRQIANAHTVFNLANTALFIGFAPQFARFAERLVPDRPLPAAERVRARYLDEALLVTPALAMDRARMELQELGDLVAGMFRDALPAVLRGNEAEIRAVTSRDDRVDALHGQIIRYLARIGRTPVDTAQTRKLLKLVEATNSLEAVGDVIETNLGALGCRRVEEALTVSDETAEVIGRFHAAIARTLDDAIRAVTDDDLDAARRVIAEKASINAMADAAALHVGRRLDASELERITAYRLETDLVENLKRVYYFAKRVSRGVVLDMPED